MDTRVRHMAVGDASCVGHFLPEVKFADPPPQKKKKKRSFEEKF